MALELVMLILNRRLSVFLVYFILYISLYSLVHIFFPRKGRVSFKGIPVLGKLMIF